MTPAPRTISQRFLGLLLLAVLVLTTALAALYAYLGYVGERDHLRQELGISTQLSGIAIEDFVAHHLSAVAVMAAVPPPPEHTPPVLLQLKARFPAFASVLLTDAQGRVLDSYPRPSTPAGRLQDVSDRQYFRVPATTGRHHVSDAFVGRGLGSDPLVAVSAPMFRDGRFAGVVEGSLRIDSFTRARGEALHRRGFEMLVLDRSRRVVFASDGLPFLFMQPVEQPAFDGGSMQPGRVTPARRFEGVLRDSRAGWVAGVELRHGWRLYLVASDDALVMATWDRVWRVLAVVAVLAAGVLLVAAWQARRIDRGLATVVTRLRALASDFDSDARHLGDMPEELAPLGQAIIDLGDNLRRALGDLDTSYRNETQLTESLTREVAERESMIARRTVELRLANAQLASLALTDPLTGLMNRRGLDQSTGPLTDAQGVLAAPMAVIALDVDHFKRFNDRYGHPAGDRVLKRVAGALRSALRDEGDLAVRSGGEEFMAVLAGADLAAGHVVAERIRQLVHALDIRHEDAPVGHVTVSIGLIAAASGTPLAEALQGADQALYRAKQAGRDRVST